MSNFHCQCDKIERKSSHYYNEPISEFLCEFCLSEPIITVWKLTAHEAQPELSARTFTRSKLVSSSTASALLRRQESRNNTGTGNTCSSGQLSMDNETETVSSSCFSPAKKSPKPAPRLSLAKSSSKDKILPSENQQPTVRLPTPSKRADKTIDRNVYNSISEVRETPEFGQKSAEQSLAEPTDKQDDCCSNSRRNESGNMRQSSGPKLPPPQTDTDSSMNSIVSSIDDSIVVYGQEKFSREQPQQQFEEQSTRSRHRHLPLFRRRPETHRRRVSFALQRPHRRRRGRGQNHPLESNASSASPASSAEEETLSESSNNEPLFGSLNSQPQPRQSMGGPRGSVNAMQLADSEEQSQGSMTVDRVLQELMKAGMLEDSGGAAEPAQRASTSRRSERSDIFENILTHPEPRNMVEKSIKDFFRTHRGDSSMRVGPTPTDDLGREPRSSVRRVKFGQSQDADSSPGASGGTGGGGSSVGYGRGGGYLLKQPIVVGSLSPFDQRITRQFILPMFDSLVEAFLTNSSLLRAACRQTRCRLELSRRILNRKMLHGSWAKYIPLSISGPSVNAIDCCDKMLAKYVRDYRFRQLYNKEPTCCMYMREDTPDNAELCFSHQRTGMATTKFANLKLESPFLRSETEACRMPWKQGLTKHGRTAIAKGQSRQCVQFVYANAFHRRTGNVPNFCTGVAAIDKRQEMQEEANMMRHLQVEKRKRMLLPLSKA